MFHLGYNTSYRAIFIQERLLTLKCMYIYSVLLFTRNNLQNLINHQDLHNYNTRNKKESVIPKYKLSLSLRNPKIIGAKLYNKLPSSLKALQLNNIFKNRLKLFLIGKCYY